MLINQRILIGDAHLWSGKDAKYLMCKDMHVKTLFRADLLSSKVLHRLQISRYYHHPLSTDAPSPKVDLNLHLNDSSS